MRGLGCFGVIILLVIVGILVLSATGGSEEQNGKIIGEKAHRGWNQVRKALQGAQQGWSSVKEEDKAKDKSERPAEQPR